MDQILLTHEGLQFPREARELSFQFLFSNDDSMPENRFPKENKFQKLLFWGVDISTTTLFYYDDSKSENQFPKKRQDLVFSVKLQFK